MSDNQAFYNKINSIERQLPALFKRLPQIARVEGLKFIASNFKKQGFEDKPGSVNKWKNKKQGRKPNLIGEKRGGAMRRSWQGTAQQARTVFTSNLPYTAVHNNGLKAGKPPGFTMPQRTMIAPSITLNNAIETKLDALMNDLIK